MNEFIKRTITAFFLIIAAYSAIVYLPDIYFSVLLYFILSVGAYELIKLTEPKVYSYPIILLNGLVIALSFTIGKPDMAFAMIIILFSTGLYFLLAVNNKDKLETFIKDISIHFLIITYLYIPLYYMFNLKTMVADNPLSANYLLFMIFVIAIGDSGAYFVGRAIGKTKIYPIASPNKSLEGLLAAIITAGIAGWLGTMIFKFPVEVSVLTAVITGAVLEILSQLSDPIESLFKRASGKKDSGSIFPGHGGILDRLDSYIFCAPALYYIIEYFWK